MEYIKGPTILKLQLAGCNGYDYDLYFVRPAGSPYYGIRKAPQKETRYMDLIYTKKIGLVDISVQLRNEGISFGMNCKL